MGTKRGFTGITKRPKAALKPVNVQMGTGRKISLSNTKAAKPTQRPVNVKMGTGKGLGRRLHRPTFSNIGKVANDKTISKQAKKEVTKIKRLNGKVTNFKGNLQKQAEKAKAGGDASVTGFLGLALQLFGKAFTGKSVTDACDQIDKTVKAAAQEA